MTEPHLFQGAECFWGVDAHSRHVAVGIVGMHDNVACWRTYEIPSLKKAGVPPAQMAGEMLRLMRNSYWKLYELVGWRPSTVVVEHPIGRHIASAPTFMASWGVNLGLLNDQVQCPVLELKPNEWKAIAGLPGNASKDVMLGQAIAELGYKGESEHEADALWMAVAARNRYKNFLALEIGT
jgi:hypothetical protein